MAYQQFSRLFYYQAIRGKEIRLSDVKIDYFLLEDIENSIRGLLYPRKDVNPYEKFENFDTKKLHFENKTIVITDPCYVFRKKGRNHSNFPDYNKYDKPIPSEPTIKDILDNYEGRRRYEKDRNEYYKEDNIEYPENSIVNSTIYGDWSCTTYNTDTNEAIGEFCADAGLVGVFDINDIDSSSIKDKPYLATVIENFTGDVWMEIEEERGVYEEDTEWHKKGEEWIDHSVHVKGEGNINFKTTQTGL